jgi:site-specific DNA recombinase
LTAFYLLALRKECVKEPSSSIQLIPTISGDARFFTVPVFNTPIDALELRAHLLKPSENVVRKAQKVMRYAAYMRVSSEEQIGNFSIDAQRRAIQAWVQAQSGILIREYVDEGISGRTADRPEFLEMRRDAKSRKFDAIIVHKFDRFARNRTDALAIKSLLRHDYGIKVYSVSEPSEDSDGPIGALIEGIMESVADWYSRNLAQETAKGKRERALQGLHNNRPPFGLDKDKDGVLIPNEHELPGVLLAFELYSTGDWTDNEIAVRLNNEGYVQKTGKVFNTETIRGILQNRLYIGYVKYQEAKYHSDGSRNRGGQRATSTEEQWLKGKHQAVISEELFEKCQEIRSAKALHHEYYPKHRVYLLRDLIYCAHCVEHMPQDNTDQSYGKMRPHTHYQQYQKYRCRAHDYGRECPQGGVRADIVERQVVEILKNLKPPADWRTRIVEAMGTLIGDQKLDDRIKEIKEVIARMDFRWDHGFIANQEEYLSERVRLQQELERLAPIADDDIEIAADLLNNFATHWEAATGDRKKQQTLIQLIVARLWVRGDRVEAISLRANYHIALGIGNEKSTELVVDSSGGVFVHSRSRRGSNPRSRP